MTKRITLSISLPPAMVEEVERACELEHRTRSELVREALRLYLRRITGDHRSGETRSNPMELCSCCPQGLHHR
jgi:metal-responsive CopG/Arc/MetJ family transcriptional regulator